MDQDVLHACREALLAVIYLSAPAVVPAIVVGLLVAIVQTTTQIQEQTLTYVPKLVAVALALGVAGEWMLASLVRLASNAFESIPVVAK